MLSRAQEKLIRSLRTKKGREKSGRCLVEGAKLVEEAGRHLEFRFSPDDTAEFKRLVSTETPQTVAGVARLPSWTRKQVLARPTVVLLDHVQDPGNVGAILRLGLGFKAGLLLVESADPTSPKVIRSSAGAIFKTPWLTISRTDAEELLTEPDRPMFRLENRPGAKPLAALTEPPQALIIAGSEGRGISLPAGGQSVAIKHDKALESLNVTQALAIILHARYGQ
jgi:TrmH family RNA methyltransferase